MTRSILALMFLAATGGAPAQARPDFSGKWVLMALPVNGGGASVIRAHPAADRFEVAQTEKTLTQTWIFGDVQIKRKFYLDGWTSIGPAGDSTTARWEGTKLRMEITEAAPATKAMELWYLDVSGQLIVERPSASVPSKVLKATYRKQ